MGGEISTNLHCVYLVELCCHATQQAHAESKRGVQRCPSQDDLLSECLQNIDTPGCASVPVQS